LVGPSECPDPDGAGDGGADWDIGAEDGGDAEEAELDEHPPTSAAAATIASTGNRSMTITAYYPLIPLGLRHKSAWAQRTTSN
jgi:hypothetical protein